MASATVVDEAASTIADTEVDEKEEADALADVAAPQSQESGVSFTAVNEALTAIAEAAQAITVDLTKDDATDAAAAAATPSGGPTIVIDMTKEKEEEKEEEKEKGHASLGASVEEAIDLEGKDAELAELKERLGRALAQLGTTAGDGVAVHGGSGKEAGTAMEVDPEVSQSVSKQVASPKFIRRLGTTRATQRPTGQSIPRSTAGPAQPRPACVPRRPWPRAQPSPRAQRLAAQPRLAAVLRPVRPVRQQDVQRRGRRMREALLRLHALARERRRLVGSRIQVAGDNDSSMGPRAYATGC